MSRKSFTEHPAFLDASRAANEGLRRAAIDMGYDPTVLDNHEVACGRIVDDLTRLLLKITDKAVSEWEAA